MTSRFADKPGQNVTLGFLFEAMPAIQRNGDDKLSSCYSAQRRLSPELGPENLGQRWLADLLELIAYALAGLLDVHHAA